MRRNRKKFADVPAGAENPVNAAISGRDRSTLQMVADAVAHKQTFLVYQPVVRTDPPNRPAFFEGLIRVTDETGRTIPAKDFMPVVESTELGREIDRLALKMGLLALAENPGLRLSINMSARSIGYAPWMKTLSYGLKRDATVGERLILEITESSAMTVPELVINFMDSLQQQGIAFALDDFGSGYTAFRYFKDFFFDAVKIDGEFIKGIHANPDNQVLTKALVSIAQQFDMLTVAEFVETAEDAAYLASIGVDCLQGYHFGAPALRFPWEQSKTAAAG